MNVLITGGAGFIGSNLSLKLLNLGYQVVVLDNLLKQIHGENPFQSELYLKIKDKVDFIQGDVRNVADWERAIQNCDTVIHLAAETGTGQSMYEINRYVDVNVNGTSYLLDYLVNKKHNIKKVIVASSRAIYGEGAYISESNQIAYPNARSEQDLDNGIFEPHLNGLALKAIATDENAPMKPQSIYGITKQVQEQMVLNICESINIPAVALRFQNVYGPGQSLKNPYTGILSIFSTLILQNKSLNIFEDGLESRDFVYIDDVVDSIILSLNSSLYNVRKYNVGSGKATSVIQIAESLQEFYKISVPTKITGSYRKGDIRHNFANIALIKNELGFKPRIDLNSGLKSFTDWVLSQDIVDNNYEKSLIEMKSKGIMK
jgi:dTDP-L-rhamnose 4-epimerase